MRIAIMGAGAVGSFYGALLHLAGHEVVLIGRQALVSAVRDAGLVLFCVKSADTESAGATMAAHLDHDSIVLCMQLPSTIAADTLDIARSMAGQRSSTAFDVARGRRDALS